MLLEVTRRARPRALVWLAVLFGVVTVVEAAAQVRDSVPQVPPVPVDTITAPPQPPDAITNDTALVAIPPEEVSADTIPEELQEAAASVAPLRPLPEFPSRRSGWDVGRWQWDAEDLARMSGLTLQEFIERIPGLVSFRAGDFGRPAGLTGMSAGGGVVRVFLDGFELTPDIAADFGLETVALSDLSGVMVTRSLSGIQVDLKSFELRQPEAFSVVELGTGVFQTRLLRALFSRGFGERSVGTGVFDMVRTGGIGLGEAYRHGTSAFRWAYALSDNSGFQLEWRRTAVDRAGTQYPLQVVRTDLNARARFQPAERWVVEGIVGRSRSENEVDGEDELLLGAYQANLRTAYASERLVAGLAARLLQGDGDATLASSSGLITGDVGVRLGSAFWLDAVARYETGDGTATTSGAITATVSPVRPISVFGSFEFGERWRAHGRVEGTEEETERVWGSVAGGGSGLRAGGEISLGTTVFGGAYLSTGTGEQIAFGLPFDFATSVFPSPAESGVEGYFRIPVRRGNTELRLEGWYTRWFGTVQRIYTPTDLGRATLTLHGSYIGGQFEPLARVEGIRQGASLVPPLGGEEDPQIMPGIQTVNLEVRLRILDVQAFVLWNNLLIRQLSVPISSPPVPQPRIVYGASWRFRN